MRSSKPTLPVILLLLISCVSGCADRPKQGPTGIPPLAVKAPPPPAFMAPTAEPAKAGEPPNQAFDEEHAARKTCSDKAVKSRSWYERLRARLLHPDAKAKE